MTQLIECPACEAELPTALLSSGNCVCPYCKFQFVPSAALARGRNDTQATFAPVAPLPVPRKVAALREQTVESDPHDHVLSDTNPNPSSGDDLGFSVQSARSGIRSPRKNHRAAAWLTAGLLAVLAVMGTALYFAWPFKSAPVSTAKAPLPTPPTAAAKSQAIVLTDSKTPENRAKTIQPSVAENEWSELKAVPREDYYSLWNKISPHLVRLQVKTTGIERLVGGVIVDSRGYVATSYQAIRDALAIEVRSSPKSLLAGEPMGDLSDNVRGLIAADEARDIAILQVNRRFVSTFANVPLAQSRTVLPGERCVLASPPRDQSRLWLSDFPLRQVQTWGQLLPQFQTAVSDANLSQGTDASWIVGPVSAKRFVPGSPVFNFKGELVGLLTVAGADSHGIACSGDLISEVLKSEQTALKPFPIDPEVVADVQSSAESALLLPSRDSPAFSLAEALHQATGAIAQFEFFPIDGEQYGAFRKLAESIVQIDDLLQGTDLLEGQRAEVSSFLEEMLDQLHDRVERAAAAHPEKIESFDRLAWEAVEPDRGFVAFGDVVRIGQSATNGLPFVIFRLSDSDALVVTSLQFDGPIFLPGTRWLLVGRHVPELIFRSTDGPRSIEARTCDVRYVFPIEPAAGK